MPRPYAIGSDALIAGLLQPTTQWGQLMAAKDNQLQQQAYLTQQSEQELLQEQQAAAQVASFKQKIQSLPFERPDKIRISSWLKGQEKHITERLAKEYQGNLAQFMAAEGPAWMEQTLSSLQQSDEYQNGLENKENIILYKAARDKGENLIGQVVGNKYIPADKPVLDYMSGKSPKFTFNGSYKDDDDLIKHFGAQYSPDRGAKYIRTAVSDADIQNHLVATNDPKVAADKYYRKFANGQVKVFYKHDTFEDSQDHQMKLEDQRFQREDHKAKQGLDSLRKEGLRLGNAIKEKKLDGLKQADEGGPNSYLRRMIPQSIPGQSIDYTEAGDMGSRKVLPHSKYDLRSFGGQQTGKVKFAALPIFGDHGSGALGSLLGAEKVPVSKANPSGWRGGNIKEGILDRNGFNAVDFDGTEHQIVHVDPKIYTNPRELGKPTIDGPMGFAKVTVRLGSKDDAKKAGLLEGMLSFDTKVGVGAYNSNTHEVTVYTPIGSVYKNKPLERYLSNKDAGTKLTNDFMNPYTLGGNTRNDDEDDD